MSFELEPGEVFEHIGAKDDGEGLPTIVSYGPERAMNNREMAGNEISASRMAQAIAQGDIALGSIAFFFYKRPRYPLQSRLPIALRPATPEEVAATSSFQPSTDIHLN